MACLFDCLSYGLIMFNHSLLFFILLFVVVSFVLSLFAFLSFCSFRSVLLFSFCSVCPS